MIICIIDLGECMITSGSFLYCDIWVLSGGSRRRLPPIPLSYKCSVWRNVLWTGWDSTTYKRCTFFALSERFGHCYILFHFRGCFWPLCCGEYLKVNVYRNNFHTVAEMQEIFVVIRIRAGILSWVVSYFRHWLQMCLDASVVHWTNKLRGF
jgi:hypothetical protein